MPLVFGRSIFGFAVVSAPPAVTWTNPDLTNASYDSVSFSVSAQDSAPHDLYIKPDGTKFYITGTTGNAIFEYNMSTAWDLSTSSYSQSFSVGAQETSASGIFFKSDGTKMYVTGPSGDDVNEYNLSTAWDVSTASYSQVFSVAAQMNNPRAIFFKDDGTKMFIADQTGSDINEYSLSTGWDVSTASFTQLFSTSSQSTSPQAVYFSPDGTEMFVADASGDIYEYYLSTGWDLSTASYASTTFDASSQAPVPVGLFFKSDGSKMYALCTSTDAIFQYSTVAPAWTNPDIAAASYDSVSFSVASQDNNPRAVTFSSDGSKMFMLGTTADSVYQYSLSTSWDPSSATYDSVSFSVGTQETSSGSIIFKSDGTSFYVIGYGNSVYQYDLTTAHDLSTASYASKSLSTGLTNAVGLSISTDGTKLWAADIGGTIQQFTMSTAWDVSTASSDSKSLDVSARGTTTTGIYVSHDGSAVYITNLGTDTIYEYDLSTDYDISTGTYNSVSFSVATQETNPWGFTFKNDGSKMYLIGNIGDSVYQYST